MWYILNCNISLSELFSPFFSRGDLLVRKTDLQTCLNVTQRRLKSFTSPRVFHRGRTSSFYQGWRLFNTLNNEVKDLGVTLDRHLTFNTHINNICLSASRSIHHIGKIMNFLSRSATERLIEFMYLSLQNLITATAFFMAYPPTS